MAKYLRVFALVVVGLFFFSGQASAYSAETKEVWINDNGVATKYTTNANTVDELLTEQNIVMNFRDKISANNDDPICSGSEIEIHRGFFITVNIDGQTQKVKVAYDSLSGTVIAQLEKERNTTYAYTGSRNAALTPKTELVLSSQKQESFVTAEAIPFQTISQETDELLVGETKVKQEGQDGQKQVSVNVFYVGGKEASRSEPVETILQAPVDKIVLIGTRPQPVPEAQPAAATVSEDLGFAYTAVYTMNASAYTASSCKSPGSPSYGITATGCRATKGVVAVDPNTIPLGTKLYVEGYGYAVAADVGGAIKGNKIDLYYDTLGECYSFGRRNVTVYVLAD